MTIIHSEELFPEGLGKITCMIKEEGMKPGLWFEIDNVGKESEVYNLQEHLLKRMVFYLRQRQGVFGICAKVGFRII